MSSLSIQQGIFLNGLLPLIPSNTGSTPNPTGTVPSSSGGFQRPAFCHDLECPKYTVLETNDSPSPICLLHYPPLPTEDGVFIRSVPQITVLVKQYGGYSTEDMKREKLEELINDLNTANKVYRDDMFFTAGYDGPYAFVRHNEIWVAAL